METANTLPDQVDQNELRSNQALSSIMLLTAFLLSQWELVAVQAGIFLIATAIPRLHPYRLIYLYLFQPLGLLKADWRNDHSEAHRFAVLLGFATTATASFLLINGFTQIGWGLVWLIIVLTAIAILGWCAGCYTYYALHRVGLSRFFKHGPIACTIPGARPPKST